MQFKEGKCPKCFGILQMPAEREEIICMYCGEKIRTAEAESLCKSDKEEYKQAPDCDLVENNEESLLYAKEHVKDLFYSITTGFANFKKNAYKEAFEIYFRSNYEIYMALEKVHLSDNRENEQLNSIAKIFVDAVVYDFKDLNKRTKERKLIDCNLIMAVYVLPGVLYYGGEFPDIFTDLLIKYWSKAFPSTNLGKATFETINSGFKTKLCYITTAVCESLGKTDDCYELSVFRNYRDSYLAKQPEGMEMIYEYYDIAPTIVNRVNKMDNRKDIYGFIWNEYLKPCINLIEEDRNEECKEMYSNMVRFLQKKFVEVKND